VVDGEFGEHGDDGAARVGAGGSTATLDRLFAADQDGDAIARDV